MDHNCVELAKFSRCFIENNFPCITFEEEFCELPKDLLLNFLDSELLKVESEYQVGYIYTHTRTHVYTPINFK